MFHEFSQVQIFIPVCWPARVGACPPVLPPLEATQAPPQSPQDASCRHCEIVKFVQLSKNRVSNLGVEF